MIYRAVFKLLLQRIDPEAAHRLAARALRLIADVPVVAAALRRLLCSHDPALAVNALGLRFASPLGVAAGMDKDATSFEGLGLLGFGFVEVGTVTARAQSGNPRPRVFRLLRDRALLNRMGFPNPGAHEIAGRLRRRTGEVIVGVNVGKSMATPVELAGSDYRETVRKLAGLCDYLVVNVSSPNTPGLKEMQAVELLRPLLAEVMSAASAASGASTASDVGATNEIAATREVTAAHDMAARAPARSSRPPVLLKIGPDLSDEQIDAIADLALELSLDGIVAVNTTEDRSGVSNPRSIAAVQGGGISGPPLGGRALEVLRRLHAKVGGEMVLISVGGISSAADAWERLSAGATLLQAYTGFVYGGPGWPARVNRELARRLRKVGATSIEEIVGSAAGRTAGSRREPIPAMMPPHESLRRP